MPAADRLQWAAMQYKNGLFALTSAGVDSAVMLDQIASAGLRVPIIHINTGFLPPETISFRDELRRRYNLTLREFGPTEDQVADITRTKLWDLDLARYSRITKLEPLSHAIRALGVTALIAGVRRDQTKIRAALDFIGYGPNGEIRLHPLLDWDQTQVERYIATHNLPRNPLYYKGYQSVEDRHLTKPGHDRSGRARTECGIHVTGGKVIRNTRLT